MAGEKDIVTEFRFTQELYSKIICPDKKFHSFPDGLHSPHIDFEYNEWMTTLLDWTEHKIKSYTPSHQCI